MHNVCSWRHRKACELLVTKLLWNSTHEAAHGISLHRVGRPEGRLMGVFRLWPRFGMLPPTPRGHSTVKPIQYDPIRSVHSALTKLQASGNAQKRLHLQGAALSGGGSRGTWVGCSYPAMPFRHEQGRDGRSWRTRCSGTDKRCWAEDSSGEPQPDIAKLSEVDFWKRHLMPLQ